MAARKKARRGRPPIEEARTERVQVRYTPSERAALERLAEHDGVTLSDVVRRLTKRQLTLAGVK